MRKPHKSTFDKFVDAFADFPIPDQDRALILMTFENRRAKHRALDLDMQRRATEALHRGPKTNGQPITGVLDAMQEDS